MPNGAFAHYRRMQQSECINPGERASVLCVESDTAACDRLALVLEAYDCSFASIADDVVRDLDARAFDAYVLDYWMPDWSGPLLCREIRKQDPHTPVIVCTDASDPVQERRARHAGASEYLVKPFDDALLGAKIGALLRFSDSESLRAAAPAERAFRNELARCGLKLTATTDWTQALAGLGDVVPSIERSARARSCKAFIDSGGTRARFERWWAEHCQGLFSAAAR